LAFKLIVGKEVVVYGEMGQSVLYEVFAYRKREYLIKPSLRNSFLEYASGIKPTSDIISSLVCSKAH
jgi:hypothetical protein